MPYPQKGEAQSDYIARFMKSGEAESDFPDEKQRLAVAYSMYKRNNSIPSYGQAMPWPKQYQCNFIEPGVVFYGDLGLCEVCGDKFSCPDVRGEECRTPGATILVKQEALEKMAKSFIGKPVIDKVHKDVSPSTIADGEADGIVTDVYLDPKTGWWCAKFLVWDPETQSHCDSPAYSVSCAYEPTDVDDSGGEYHNLPYAEEIKNGEYTHLAIVTSPRYEGARIFVNSKGGRMSWKFWEKGARKNAAPLDPDKTMINVDGKDVALKELYDALPDEAPKFNDDTAMETPKGEKTLGELKAAYRNKVKKNAEMKCESCGQMKPKENFGKPGEKTVEGAEGAEAGHAEHREGGKLPDLKASVDNPDQAQAAAKELDKSVKAEEPIERRQEAEVTEGDAEKAAKDLDKEEKIFSNAEEKEKAEEKADEELRAASEKADKEKLLANAKKDAAKKSFSSLRNARGEGLTGDSVAINPVSMSERLDRGAKKYGSA